MPKLHTDSNDYGAATFLGEDANLLIAAPTGWYAKEGVQRRWVKSGTSTGSFATNASGCIVAPTVQFNQNNISNIGYESVKLSANVTDDGGENVKNRGFLLLENTYSGVPNLTSPNANQIQLQRGSGTGSYETTKSALKAKTTYKVVAYAYGQEYSNSLNDLAVGYSDTVLTFTTATPIPITLGYGNDDGAACAASQTP